MIRCYQSENDLASGLSLWFEELMHEIAKSKSIVHVALSGGKTPALFFDKLADSCKIPWDILHFYWVDERCVGPDNPESNYGMTVQHLFKKIQINKSRIHRIIGENDPVVETERYAAEMLSNVKLKNGIPEFDLILLGVGGDGHTASIFPERVDLLNYSRVCAVVKHPGTGQKRITLTGKVLLNAEKIIFLASGSSKKQIIRNILEDQDSLTTVPAAYINRNHPDVSWFMDDEAAAYLNHACND